MRDIERLESECERACIEMQIRGRCWIYREGAQTTEIWVTLSHTNRICGAKALNV